MLPARNVTQMEPLKEHRIPVMPAMHPTINTMAALEPIAEHAIRLQHGLVPHLIIIKQRLH